MNCCNTTCRDAGTAVSNGTIFEKWIPKTNLDIVATICSPLIDPPGMLCVGGGLFRSSVGSFGAYTNCTGLSHWSVSVLLAIKARFPNSRLPELDFQKVK